MLLSAPRASQSAATAGRGREGDLRRPVRVPGGLRGRGTAPRPARDQRERAAPEQPQPATTPPPPHRFRSHLVLDPLRLPSSLQFSPHSSIQFSPHSSIQFSPHSSIHLSPHPPSNSHPTLIQFSLPPIHPILTSIHFSPLIAPILTPTSIQFSPHPPSNPLPTSIHFSPLTHPILTPSNSLF